jgi:hypothetical protein
MNFKSELPLIIENSSKSLISGVKSDRAIDRALKRFCASSEELIVLPPIL